jgi:alpha-N-arabinofuranosidase
VGEEHTTIWAQFAGVDPNERQVEINVRQTVFYPDLPGRNYLTVRGFIMRHAATPWAPPTTEQMALIGTHWSKGWLIENNVISHSICSGLSLGKYGDQPGRKAQSAEAYVKVVERAIANGWSKENIGGHIVRNNVISHCEQAGIVGSLGAVFSTIEGNMIHDVHVRRLFGGEEMAGIKLHGAIDVRIARNRIYRTVLGLWLDWMAQGTQVSGNLFHDNGHDLFAEVNHGPYLVDHNIFLSPGSVFSMSQGGAFAHNLMAGRIRLSAYNKRATPYHRPHSTEIAGMHENPSGDDRFHHNLIVGRGDLSAYDNATWPVWMDGNVFLQGAKPSQHEVEPTVRPEYDPELKCAAQGEGCYLTIRMDGDWAARRPRRLITTELLGRARIPDQPFVHPDGSPLALNRDYFGQRRDESHPVPGPFEHRASGLVTFKVW